VNIELNKKVSWLQAQNLVLDSDTQRLRKELDDYLLEVETLKTQINDHSE